VSRIGKKEIVIPENVKVELKENVLTVQGPKGAVSENISSSFGIETSENILKVVIKGSSGDLDAKHGLYRALIANMILGVTNGFEIDMDIVGVGYRVQLQGNDLVFSLGYSHPVKYEAPTGIKFVVEGQNKIKVVGINKQKVGQVASELRALRSPDPYKGKGVKYAYEIIKKKQGKSVKK
jgi:large subunit ribosomal protein L6